MSIPTCQFLVSFKVFFSIFITIIDLKMCCFNILFLPPSLHHSHLLIVSGVSCSRWVLDLHWGRIFSCSMQTLSCSIWDIVFSPEIKPRSLNWECRVIDTGPSGKSLTLMNISRDILLNVAFIQDLWNCVPMKYTGIYHTEPLKCGPLLV